MFDRSMLKSNAKQSLSRFYGLALVAAILFTISSGISSLFTTKVDVSTNVNPVIESISDLTPDNLSSFIPEFFESVQESIESSFENLFSGEVNFTALPAASLLIDIAILLLFTYQIEVGFNRFFLNARENSANLGDLFWTYKNNLGTTIGTLLCRDIFIFLWSLLLVVPGIIKYYEYSMVSSLLAENPNMTRRRAFELSRAMTRGYKGKLFVLDLSFIGWYLLCVLACCCCCFIGPIFLIPYVQATKAEAYTFLKARALERNEASAEDFPGFITAD